MLTWLSLGLVFFSLHAALAHLLACSLSLLIGFYCLDCLLVVGAAVWLCPDRAAATATSSPSTWVRLTGAAPLGVSEPVRAATIEKAQTWLGLLLVCIAALASLWLSRVGSFTNEDALVHLAHVRDLLDLNAVQVADPLLGGDIDDVRYDGSLFHPFLAVASRLSHAAYAEIWHDLSALLLPLVALALWALGAELFGSSLVGLLAALAFISVHGLDSKPDADLLFLAYPGGVGLYLLTPLLWYQAWRWRLRGAPLDLILAAGLSLTLSGTHLFYALLLAGSAAAVLPVLTLWGPSGTGSIRIRTAIVLLAILIPLALTIVPKLDGVSQVQNPFFLQAQEADPPRHGSWVVETENGWRLSWDELLGQQGIRPFPSKAPVASLWLCLPLLYWVWKRNDGAVFLLVLTCIPALVNLLPPLLELLQEQISIHKVIRLGQLMPIALVLGWALERVAVAALELGIRLRRAALPAPPVKSSTGVVLFAVLLVGYVALDDNVEKPLLRARERLVQSATHPTYAAMPFGLRNQQQIGLLEFFSRHPFRDRAVLSHAAESMLLAAYTGHDVTLVPSYHASPALADAEEREAVTGRIIRGDCSENELLDWLAAHNVGMAIFGRDRLRPKGRALLEQCSALERWDGPLGYELWQVIGSRAS